MKLAELIVDPLIAPVVLDPHESYEDVAPLPFDIYRAGALVA